MWCLVGPWREIAGQTVTVEIGGQRAGDRGPERRALQPDRLRGLLLEADEWIGLEEAAHPRQRAGETGLHRDVDAAALDAARRQRVGRRRDRQRVAAVELSQRRLQHADRHRGGDKLGDLEAILRARLVGGRLPGDAEGVGRHVDRPDDFLRRPGSDDDVLRRQGDRQPHDLAGGRPGQMGRALQGRMDLHLARRRVAQRQHREEAIAVTHQRRQAGKHLQVLRDADAGAAGAELLHVGVGDGDQSKARQRIVERHLDRRFPVGVEDDVRLPDEQRVEELARRAAAAATARRHRLLPVVAPADDLALGGARLDAPGALLHHRVEQPPRVVAAQREQALVDGRERDLGAGQRLAALRHAHLGDRLLADQVLRLVGDDAHLQLVRRQADPDRGDTELERRLGKIDHRRRRLVVLAVVAKAAPPGERLLPSPGEERVPGRVADPPAQRQHAHIDVRSPRRLDLQLDRRIVAAQGHDLRRDHAFALDRDQRRRLAKRHPHLQSRGLARLVALLLGQDVDAVVVVLGKPELALLRDPDARRGLCRVALRVLAFGDQLDLAGRVERRLAGEQALVVRRARAERAEVLHLGAVVVGIEAADQALARRDHLADAAAHGDGLAFDRLAARVEGHHRELRPAAVARPRAGLHAEDDGARPEVDRRRHRLRFAVRVVERHLGFDPARARARWQVLQLETRSAAAIGRERQLVGDELAVARVVVARVLLTVRVLPGLRVARRLEGELVVAGERRRARLQERRSAERRVGHGATGEVAHLHVDRDTRRGDGRRLRPGHPCVDERQAEFLDAEVAARPGGRARPVLAFAPATRLTRGRVALEHDLVDAEPGRRRDVPGRVGAAARAGPCQRERVFLARALMDDLDARRQQRGREEREPGRGLDAREVLHRDRLAGAKERAVEDRRDAHVGLGAAARGHVEAPRLDALLPRAEDEGDVGRAAALASLSVRLARGDEVAAVGDAVIEFRVERLGHDGQALRVGAPAPERLAVAIVDDDVGAFDRFAAIERRHPDDAVLAPELEMHAQVGDEHAGAHEHRRALVEQRLAEPERLDLDDVIARLGEGNADDLERARIATLDLRQVEPARAGLLRQQRDFARADVLLDAVLHDLAVGPRLLLEGVPLALGQAELPGGHLRLVVFLQLRVPGEDVGVALQPLDAHLAAGRGGAQVRLHVTQRHRQHGVGVALDDAERRRRELGDRRRAAGLHLERKGGRVGERPTGVVLQPGRQLDGEGGVLGERRAKRDLAHLGCLVVLVEDRRQRLAACGPEADLRGGRTRDRRAEAHAHRPDRQAGRIRTLALAGELGGKGGADDVAKALLDRREHFWIGTRRNALAPDETHRRAVRKRPLATRNQGPLRLRRSDVARLQDLVAHGAADDAQRQPLADALDLAPGVGDDARLDGSAVQAHQEVLVFLDLAASRLHRDNGWPAGREGELRLAGEHRAGRGAGRAGRRLRHGLPVGAHCDDAARARAERFPEVVEPDPLVGPSAAACGHAALARDRRRIGEARIAEGDDALGELDDHLAHLCDLALRRHGDDARAERRCGPERRSRRRRRPCGPDASLHPASRGVGRV